MIGPAEAAAFERCITGGGVAVFPTDTLYGIGCAPGDEAARERLYELKGRPRDKPSALMCFSMNTAADLLAAVGRRTRAAAKRLLPGPILLVLPGGVGLRVPRYEPLEGVEVVVLQTSANLTGGPDPRRLDDVPSELRAGADLVLDGGELSGVASTVVDLTRYEDTGEWEILRDGAVPAAKLSNALRS